MSNDGHTDREYYRARAAILVRYGADTAEGRRIMAMDRELWDAQSTLEDTARQVLETGDLPDDLKPLVPVLRWLDFKLDLVLHHLRLRELGMHFPRESTTTDISGSGVGMAAAEGLTSGDRLLLALTLPQSPSRPVYAVGEVVRRQADDKADEATAAVRFVEIAESDRERIIRYTFRQQRRELSQRMQTE